MSRVLALAVAPGVALQAGPAFDVDVSLGQGVLGGAVSAFLTTLLVGAILVAIAPGYVDRLLTAVADEPVGSVLSGLAALLALLVLSVLLVLTIVGILVVIPLLVVAYLLWAVGATLAFLAIAVRIVDRDDGWATPLLVAALLNGGLLLTGVGGLVSFLVGAAGFGAVVRDALG